MIDKNEMDGVKLMNRTDTKFAFKADKLQIVVKEYNAFL